MSCRNKPEAHRDTVEFANVERDKPEGTRVDKEVAHLLREYSEGRRVDKFESFVSSQFDTGHVGPRAMYIPKTEVHAERTDTYEIELKSSSAGNRITEQGIWLPQALRGEREDKTLMIEDTVYEALKSRDSKNLFLDDEMYVALKGSKELNIEKLWQSLKI
ncbi:hypothetical protein Q0F98_02135 [Paenibacillus amylolyticus]|nr:hypothetical protein Q0F98_02135 [Paenibacillus amylolyticus]